MTGNKEIKSRIAGISDTQKLTNAMYLIASSKLRKAKAELLKTRPYFDELCLEISAVCAAQESAGSRYVKSDSDSGDGVRGIIVITGERGMAGAYNHNVIKAAIKEIAGDDSARVFIAGEYGRTYFTKAGMAFENDFLYSAQEPTFQRARDIRDHILPLYDSGEINSIALIYTDTVNGIESTVKINRVLPVDTSGFEDIGNPAGECEFLPSAEAVMNSIVPSYLAGYIYSALVESFCCEQNARMTAMEQADKNAGELIDTLLLKFNSARRAAITNEITEVNAGAKALKRKEAKR